MCFVETSGRLPAASAPKTSAWTRWVWTRSGSNEAIARRSAAHRRNAVGDAGTLELGVERLWIAASVEPDERDLEAGSGQCREQRQQMPLRAADAGDPVHVDDAHRAQLGFRRR